MKISFLNSKFLFAVVCAISLLFVNCSSDDDSCEPNPELITSEASNITDSSALISALITPPSCDTSIISQGFVYSESNLPQIEDANVIELSGSEISYFDKSRHFALGLKEPAELLTANSKTGSAER